MKKIILCLFLVSFLGMEKMNAQIFGKQSATKIITRQIEKRLPDLINENSKVTNLNIDRIKIRWGRVKVKGKFSLNEKDNKIFSKPFRIKTNISTNLKNPSIRKLKIHIPGDKFLFFRRYRRVI